MKERTIFEREKDQIQVKSSMKLPILSSAKKISNTSPMKNTRQKEKLKL